MVQRYLDTASKGHIEFSTGPWVKYEDYAALEQELLALRKEREAAVPDGLLAAFDIYARQFTYNNHPAKPEMFPKEYPFFEAGYAAAILAQKK